MEGSPPPSRDREPRAPGVPPRAGLAAPDLAVPLAAGLLLALLLSIRIGAPWSYIHDDNGAWTQAVASAHLIAGVSRTRGQDFFLRQSDGQLEPYLHHPPLYGLAAAAAYAAVGRADPLVTRLVPAAFHIAGFLGFVVLGRILLPRDALARGVAAILYAIVPMSAFFGKVAFNEPIGLCFVVWGTVFLASWRARPRPAALAGAAAFWALAGMSSWPAFPILLALFALHVLEAYPGRDRAKRPAVFALGAVGLVVFPLVMVHLQWANDWGAIRVGGAAEHWGIHTLGPARAAKAIGRAFDFHRIYFANVPFFLFLLWAGSRVRAIARGEAPCEATRVLLAGALGCGFWALLFVRQVALHGYGQFWFLPFELLAAGMLGASMWRRGAARPRLRAAVAALAIAGTVLSSAGMLRYRYAKPHGYAVRTSAGIAATYVTSPWTGAPPDPRGDPQRAGGDSVR